MPFFGFRSCKDYPFFTNQKGAAHLSISADGTFTANEPLAAVMETTTGKWALADYENGCYVYSFVMEDTGYWYNYETLPTGELNAWGWLADDEWIDVVLVKDE